MKHILTTIIIVSLIVLVSCYSFTGASISPDVKTLRIDYFQNRATIVNPTLSSDFTEKLRSYILTRARLNEVEDSPDIELNGEITAYAITPMAVQSDAKAALNRLSITIRVNYINHKNEKENFAKSFTQFQEFSADLDISAVESELVETIITAIVENVFNDAFSNW